MDDDISTHAQPVWHSTQSAHGVSSAVTPPPLNHSISRLPTPTPGFRLIHTQHPLFVLRTPHRSHQKDNETMSSGALTTKKWKYNKYYGFGASSQYVSKMELCGRILGLHYSRKLNYFSSDDLGERDGGRRG